MDPNVTHNPYDVLYERERSELDVCLQHLELFRKYIRDYEALDERLSTLADKTRHDILVPIAGSKVAFMPGYIHHTNEVLILIGENYFVEKSTKEAREYVARRIADCKEKVDDLQSQQRMLENWLGATADMKAHEEQKELGDIVEINETCTEEEFEKWNEEHKGKVQEHRQEMLRHIDNIDIDKILEKYEDDDVDDDEEYEEDDEEEEVEEKKPTQSEISIPKVLEKTVVEHQFDNLTLAEKTRRDTVQPSEAPSSSQETRPMSKFKASRMKK